VSRAFVILQCAICIGHCSPKPTDDAASGVFRGIAWAHRGKPPLRIVDFGLRIVKHGVLFFSRDAQRSASVEQSRHDPESFKEVEHL
jgi:hypothetical protein